MGEHSSGSAMNEIATAPRRKQAFGSALTELPKSILPNLLG